MRNLKVIVTQGSNLSVLLLVLWHQYCATTGGESDSRTWSSGSWYGTVPPSLVYCITKTGGTTRGQSLKLPDWTGGLGFGERKRATVWTVIANRKSTLQEIVTEIREGASLSVAQCDSSRRSEVVCSPSVTVLEGARLSVAPVWQF